MIITKIHRKNTTNNSKKFIVGISAVVFVFLMLTAFVFGTTAEKKAAQSPAESGVTQVSEQQVISLALNS